jgi:hypothetical protein
VLQAGEVSLGRRQVSHPAILLHQPVERAPRDRIAAVAREQDRRGDLPLAQEGLERLRLVGLQRVRARVAALEAVDHDPQGLQVDVLDPQQPDLARPQPVPVGDEEERPVAAVRADRPEQAGGLVEGQEADGLARRARHGRMPTPSRNCPE